MHSAHGAARMGINISNGVIEGHARVFGVVDASSSLILQPGHPMGIIYALAELISGYILNVDGESTCSNASVSSKPAITASSTSVPAVANARYHLQINLAIISAVLLYLF